MAKILLVEDDNNLREIYEARLVAEGYDIVAARDGEEALTVAMKEKPDLIISDVMMPKISGFDMLDILRSTKETKDAKVIMMTALSQAEDKARAEKLGADRYLVKSQVTLEDVAKVAKEVLEGTSPAPTTEPAAATAAPVVAVAAAAAAAPAPQPASASASASASATSSQPQSATQTPDPEPAPPAAAPQPQPTQPPEPIIAPAVDPPAADQAPVIPVVPTPDPQPATDDTANDKTDGSRESTEESGRKKTIEPLNDIREDSESKLKELLEKEKVKEEMAQGVQETIAKHDTVSPPVVPSKQADINTPEAPVTPPSTPTPGSEVDPDSIAL